MEWPFVVVADAVVEVQLGSELPGISGVEEPGVDKDLTFGIADGDAGGRGLACEEVGEGVDAAGASGDDLAAIEGEGAGGVAVVELIELRLAELAAEAHLVLALDPGELVGEVAGDVVTSLGRRLADGIEALDGDIGRVGEGSAGDKAESLDVLSGLEVVEDLVEVVDADEQLVSDGGREDVVLDDGDVLHVNGGYLVVGEELGADRGDLIALADEPVGAEDVLGGEVVVDLGETVPAIAVFGVGGVEVVDGAGGVLGEDVGSPEVVENALHDGIDGDALGGEEGLGLGLPADGGLGGGSGFADDEALMLKGEEAEELVLDERSADGEAGVVVADLLLGIGEGALGSEELVAIEVVDGSVQGVGSGAEGEVDGSAGVASAFGAGLGLGGELVDRVDGQDDAGDAGDAALVDGGDVVPEVVVVDAVDLPVDLVGASSVERAEAAAAVSTEAGREGDHLGEVAAVERDVFDGLGVEHGVLGDRGGVERDGCGFDLDGGVRRRR